MKNILLFLVAATLLAACGQSNNAGSTTTGSDHVTNTTNPGRQLFINNCVQCHTLKQDKLGPMLDGTFARWNNDSLKIAAFIKNSQQVITGGQSPYATALYHKWSDATMPPFSNLGDEEIKEILGYIHTGVE